MRQAEGAHPFTRHSQLFPHSLWPTAVCGWWHTHVDLFHFLLSFFCIIMEDFTPFKARQHYSLSSFIHLFLLLLLLWLDDVVAQDSILVLLLGGFWFDRAAQCIPHTSHENGTEEIFHWHEGVDNSQEDWGELEIDEENDDAQVDQRMRHSDVVELLAEEDHWRHQGSLCHAG